MEEQKRKLEEEEEKRRSEEAKVIWSAGMFWFQRIFSLCKQTYCSPKGERRRGSMEGRADQHGIARSQLVSIYGEFLQNQSFQFFSNKDQLHLS